MKTLQWHLFMHYTMVEDGDGGGGSFLPTQRQGQHGGKGKNDLFDNCFWWMGLLKADEEILGGRNS